MAYDSFFFFYSVCSEKRKGDCKDLANIIKNRTIDNCMI